jgi:hypothetical protein
MTYGIHSVTEQAEKALIGNVVAKLEVTSDCARFTLADGTTFDLGVEGDCCSCSYYESVQNPEWLLGQEVRSIDWNAETGASYTDEQRAKDEAQNHYIAVYGFSISTDKGTCVFEFRNDSNGYYGGYLAKGDFRAADAQVITQDYTAS